MNLAGNNINHPENIGPDPHAPGTTELQRAKSVVLELCAEACEGLPISACLCLSHGVCCLERLCRLGSPLPRAVFANDVGYLPDGTPLNKAGNAINHPEAWHKV